MAISAKLRGYMNRCGTRFEELEHPPTQEMARAAEAAHVPGRQVAKGVLVRADDKYLLAVVPASKRVELDRMHRWLGCDVRLADERESTTLFSDCQLGAIPPVGAAFGVSVVLDDDMLTGEDVYFEGGDHSTLIHVDAANWRRLQKGAPQYAIST